MARHRSGQTQRGQFIAIGTAGLLTALGFVRAAPPSLTLPITVHCTTAEARVYMDDVELGRTGETLAVPFGRDVPLVVSAPYHIPANIFLPCLVPGDPPLELPVRLEPLPASLVVAAQSPSRLRKTTTGCLAINGRDLGEVHLPFVTNHLPPGDYHITLNVQGYQVPPERTVALPPGQQTRVLFELDYLESILRFNVTPSNAAIRVGMENVTNADRSCHVVPHRIYDIVVTAPGYYPARFEDAAMPCSATSRTWRWACATPSTPSSTSSQGARTPAAQGQHRGQEGLLRLGALQGIQGADARGRLRADRDPHVRQSGKNSADIRMVVDALDLCYTKSHVDTFVIISGDSDFSPLVSKLRENNKR
jgi:uncharacterized LabA/DUF88 family protein